MSACLLGQNVRYDGKHKYLQYIETILKPITQIVSFCPEVAAGLGTPRPAVKLIKQESSSSVRAIGVDNSSLDVTDALVRIANCYAKLFTHVDGIIFKARSPSCGWGTTQITLPTGNIIGNGLFADIIAKSCPHIKLIDEERFMDKQQREYFLQKLNAGSPSSS